MAAYPPSQRTAIVASLGLNIVLAFAALILLNARSESSRNVSMISPAAIQQPGTMMAPSSTSVNFHRRFKFQPRRKPNPPAKWPMKVGDKVQVIAGGDKGKESEITRIFRKTGYVLCKDVNMKTRHQRGREEGETGSIIQMEAPIHHSNLKVLERYVYQKPEKVEAAETA
mmetsp:Transcript_6965/g.17074  ORF Transcript_6965/g.17074 Transcript_6965/m.17074 type:complete len:170 (-) Transcript_6965:108-617(-)